jgi:hypothetical protein
VVRATGRIRNFRLVLYRADLQLMRDSIKYALGDPTPPLGIRPFTHRSLFYLGLLGGWDGTFTLITLAGIAGYFISGQWQVFTVALSLSLTLAYGSRRALVSSYTRYQVLRVLKAPPDQRAALYASPVVDCFNTTVDSLKKPGAIGPYLRRIRRLNRVSYFLDKGVSVSEVLTVGSILPLYLRPGLATAAVFIASMFSWIGLLVIGMVVAFMTASVKDSIPQAWTTDDIRAVVQVDDSPDVETESRDAIPQG